MLSRSVTLLIDELLEGGGIEYQKPFADKRAFPHGKKMLIGHVKQNMVVRSAFTEFGTHEQLGFLSGWRWRYDPESQVLCWWDPPIGTSHTGDDVVLQDHIDETVAHIESKAGPVKRITKLL